jgi:hypothetical protein
MEHMEQGPNGEKPSVDESDRIAGELGEKDAREAGIAPA